MHWDGSRREGLAHLSGRVEIVSYEGIGWHLQCDHEIARDHRCIYLGLSFEGWPVLEHRAWEIAGFPCPPRSQEGRNLVWQDEPGVFPFKRVGQIFAGGTDRVGKLTFSVITVEESRQIYG